MKKVIAVVFVVGMAASAFAQNGPAYKNMKPAEKYKGSSTILVRADRSSLQGPQAKNQTNRDIDRSAYRIVKLDKMNGKNLRGLHGPAYKNHQTGKMEADYPLVKSKNLPARSI